MHKITTADLRRARAAYEKNVPRDLFYQAATALVSLAFEDKVPLTIGDAVSVLLETWNRAYFRFHPVKDKKKLYDRIDRLIKKNIAILTKFRSKTIRELDHQDEIEVRRLFCAFENEVGAVGAAKALHLLAPQFFPLWDAAIAKAYGVSLRKTGSKEEEYWKFICISQRQCRDHPDCQNPLKRIDEFNYCEYTTNWWRGKPASARSAARGDTKR